MGASCTIQVLINKLFTQTEFYITLLSYEYSFGMNDVKICKLICTSLQVAQVGDKNCYPAGTDDTSFSVEGTDIVITYGAITSSSSGAAVTRYSIVVLQCTGVY